MSASAISESSSSAVTPEVMRFLRPNLVVSTSFEGGTGASSKLKSGSQLGLAAAAASSASSPCASAASSPAASSAIEGTASLAEVTEGEVTEEEVTLSVVTGATCSASFARRAYSLDKFQFLKRIKQENACCKPFCHS